ncbi:head-tail connector protein [Silvimonas soli]|uniref:head-tail connector protein n=1 Tax=Silvimonas soli TaxID=2980100 RepID=UPI0024B38178|nr:head-tail connector protein [Silvimonas soli]
MLIKKEPLGALPIALESEDQVSVKGWLREGMDAQDPEICMLMAAAFERAEFLTHRVWVARGVLMQVPDFSYLRYLFDLSPVTAVESLEYLDPSGELQSLDPATYRLASGMPDSIVPAIGTSWPSVAKVPDAIRIKLKCGEPTVPASILQWVCMRVNTAYENREAVLPGTQTPLPDAFVDGLLDAYRIDGVM